MNSIVMNEARKRTIRSFVQRNSRATSAQQKALRNLWPQFGIDYDESARQPLDLDAIFGRKTNCILEIGFGDGESLLRQAHDNSSIDYLGLEVYQAGIGHLMLRAEELQLSNIRVICADAAEVLRNSVSDRSLAGMQIFFPDPWPKKRHHKRRLVQPEFISLAARKIRHGGRIHLATDWQHYAEHMLAVLDSALGLQNCYSGFVPPPPPRPATKFESRGRRLGHQVRDLIFQIEEINEP